MPWIKDQVSFRAKRVLVFLNLADRIFQAMLSHHSLANVSAHPGLEGPTTSSTLSFVARGQRARLVVQENVRRQPDFLWEWPGHRMFRFDVSTKDV
jgi:hypothetical protein